MKKANRILFGNTKKGKELLHPFTHSAS
jgi:hypothetical protein